jgi:catechol 2,3-dioxygenase-like lactoylglutathione lyase family enzyme
MPIIRIADIAHVAFTAPDLDQMAAFLTDFGIAPQMVGGTLYGFAQGHAPFVHATTKGDAAFAALGLRAESVDDLHVLAEAEQAAVIANPAPGGGMMVVLHDPDGNRIEVVAGQDAGSQAAFARDGRIWNRAGERPRIGRAPYVSAAPAHVTRLGHIVLDVTDFRASESWYKDRFGFITSDEIEAAPGFSLGAFMRCDRGAQPTDHHTLFLLQHPNGKGFNHAAFEVADLDDLMTGHTHLKAQGRDPHWGVGRHILGNQVFDYWKDPWGHTLEHWTDGDLLTVADGSAVASIETLLGVQWGPNMPMPQ